MLRDDIKAATIASMKAGDTARTGTLRLISSALKNRDIELRTGTPPANDDVLVAEVLSKMAKQRRESIEMYVTGNRPELADAERAELAIIESFMPAQMAPEEAKAAIAALVSRTGRHVGEGHGPGDGGGEGALCRAARHGRGRRHGEGGAGRLTAALFSSFSDFAVFLRKGSFCSADGVCGWLTMSKSG